MKNFLDTTMGKVVIGAIVLAILAAGILIGSNISGTTNSTTTNPTTTTTTKKQPISLTKSNYSNYLTIDLSVIDSTASTEYEYIPQLGTGIYVSEGNTTIQLSTINQSGAKFENVSIVCEITVSPVGWEFNNGSSSKKVTLTIPYDGNCTSSIISLEFDPSVDGSGFPSELADYNFRVKVTSISGTVVK